MRLCICCVNTFLDPDQMFLNVCRVFCDIVPKASENFLALAAAGVYDGLLFHRNMRGRLQTQQRDLSSDIVETTLVTASCQEAHRQRSLFRERYECTVPSIADASFDLLRCLLPHSSLFSLGAAVYSAVQKSLNYFQMLLSFSCLRLFPQQSTQLLMHPTTDTIIHTKQYSIPLIEFSIALVVTEIPCITFYFRYSIPSLVLQLRFTSVDCYLYFRT